MQAQIQATLLSSARFRDFDPDSPQSSLKAAQHWAVSSAPLQFYTAPASRSRPVVHLDNNENDDAETVTSNLLAKFAGMRNKSLSAGSSPSKPLLPKNTQYR